MNEIDFWEGLKGIKIGFQALAEALTKCHEWYEKNAENISTVVLAVADFGIWCSAIDKMAHEQIIFTDDLSFEYAGILYESKNIAKAVQAYYLENDAKRMNTLIARCSENSMMEKYKIYYQETVSAYQLGHYLLTCSGLFAIIDGLLSDISKIDKTNFKRRINEIKEKISDRIELSDIDRKLFCIFGCIEEVRVSMFDGDDFSKPETEQLNRNRVQHGRTHRNYTHLDALKAWLFLETILLMAEYCQNSVIYEE